jgi:hypothetical protein
MIRYSTYLYIVVNKEEQNRQIQNPALLFYGDEKVQSNKVMSNNLTFYLEDLPSKKQVMDKKLLIFGMNGNPI